MVLDSRNDLACTEGMSHLAQGPRPLCGPPQADALMKSTTVPRRCAVHHRPLPPWGPSHAWLSIGYMALACAVVAARLQEWVDTLSSTEWSEVGQVRISRLGKPLAW